MVSVYVHNADKCIIGDAYSRDFDVAFSESVYFKYNCSSCCAAGSDKQACISMLALEEELARFYNVNIIRREHVLK